jgi:hypothetical protein
MLEEGNPWLMNSNRWDAHGHGVPIIINEYLVAIFQLGTTSSLCFSFS